MTLRYVTLTHYVRKLSCSAEEHICFQALETTGVIKRSKQLTVKTSLSLPPQQQFNETEQQVNWQEHQPV